jgi:Tol biopolymer transport system component
VATDWTPDDDGLLYSVGDLAASGQLWILPLTGDRKPKSLLPCSSICKEGRFSPDGHWLAYSSNESGRFEVYIVPYGTSHTGKWQVSSGGGSLPAWRRDGRELFYLSTDSSVVSVPVTLAIEGAKVAKPSPLFHVNGFLGNVGIVAPYDVNANGQRFVILKTPKAERQNITLVMNWIAGMK